MPESSETAEEMVLPRHWATPEDFATLFQYIWHRDYPLSPTANGARRADWTIHIGTVVKQIADFMGLFPRFEHGSRKDALLRSSIGDEIAIEWEWGGVRGNELEKLKTHKVWSKDKTPPGERPLRFAVLISYCYVENLQSALDHVADKWNGAPWPLLLILITLKNSKNFHVGKTFEELIAFKCDGQGKPNELRRVSAFPWHVTNTRWCNPL